MIHNLSSKGWFFPIEEVPIHTTVTRNGVDRHVRVPCKKALVAADSGEILAFNTMTDIASHPPLSPRFRRDRPLPERRAGACLRDFTLAAAQPSFSIFGHLVALAKPPQAPHEN
ncbi:MAG: hypothetical protein NTW21_36020 [Verrucomicrobia bacterium]|nr:hypothetical protein [Verrucomicrobiota bacterium]